MQTAWAMVAAGLGQITDVSEADAPSLDIRDVLRARRSVRAFAPRDVSDELVIELLDLSRHAPSSLDGQPWQFIVVRDPEAKRRLAKVKNQYCPPEKRHYPADFLVDAPVVIIVCVDLGAAFGRHVEDGVLAAYSIMLGAARHGLTSVYLSASAPDAPELADDIRSLFTIPAGVAPVSIIPVGVPAALPLPKQLRSLETMVHYDRYRPPRT